MSHDRSSTAPEPDEPREDDEHRPDAADEEARLIERLATLDDCLDVSGGSPSGGATAAAAAEDIDPAAIADALDVILLLRQAAASERGPTSEPLTVPAHIGRFEVVREAGRGGFAFVLEAFDPLLCRRVALKVARPESLLSADIRRRFMREAEIAGRLVHPHIVSVYEVGESHGLAFIAEEYCSGGSLSEWLAEHPGPLPPRTAARLVLALAEAVSHAHANGIVHRDIKPANVLLAPLPEAASAAEILPGRLTVKLGDFGLGKLYEDGAAEGLTQLTRSGSRLGTPAWMAPEQIDHSFGAVGPATDVYGLGVLLDRLLTGRTPCEGTTEAETLRNVLLHEPVPPNRVSRGVSADLAAVCLKCLAKRPGDRYRSAAELAADVSRFLDGRPTHARPLGVATRLGRSIARRPLLGVVAAAAVAAVLLAGWSVRDRMREVAKRAASDAEARQQKGATQLRRGFDVWRSGNVAAALAHLEACATIDSGIADSFAARWLRRRLHGERDILLQPAFPRPSDWAKSRTDLYAFAFAPDGRVAAAGGADGRLSIVRLTEEGAAIGPPLVVEAHDEVNDVAFSPDGRTVATAGQDGRLRLWNVADGSAVRELPAAAGPLFAAAFSPDGASLAYGGADRILRLAPVASDAAAKEWSPFAAGGVAVAADAEIEALLFIDADRVAVACGAAIAIVRLSDGSTRPLVAGENRIVGALAVSPDGKRLLAGGTGSQPRVWDIETGGVALTLPPHPWWIGGCDFSPDGRELATGCRDGVVRVFDATTGALRRNLIGHVGRTWDVKYSRAGLLASAGADGTLRRWDPSAATDAAGMREVPLPAGGRASRPGQPGRMSLAVSGNGSSRSILVVSSDGRPILVDPASGVSRGIVIDSFAPCEAVAIDEPRRRFALAMSGGTREPLDVRTLPHLVGTTIPAPASPALEPHAEPLPVAPRPTGTRGAAVAWTPAGMLAVGCLDGTLLGWNRSLDTVATIDRFADGIESIVLSPTASRMAVVARRAITVYDLDAGALPRAAATTPVRLAPTADPILSAAWSPDGRKLVYGTNRGVIRIVDAESGEPVEQLPVHGREVRGMAWLPDGRTLVTADPEGVRFSDTATLTTFDELRPGWAIDAMTVAVDGSGVMIVIAGSPAGGSDAASDGIRLGILDLGIEPGSSTPRP